MCSKVIFGSRGSRVRMLACLVAAIAFLAVHARAQGNEDKVELKTLLESLSPGVVPDQMFNELSTHNDLRRTALHSYTARRTYQVVDSKGKVHAEEIGQMEFQAPDKKTFTVTSEAGSGMIRRMALNPLISSEIQAATGKDRRDSSISAENYSLELLGEQQLGPYHCVVAQAIPRRKDKYLFEGKLWIDINDYAVVRIEGHPAKKLSFWIERADFVRQYQKIDRFWLPKKDETFVHVRFYGNKVLTIEHSNYVVNDHTEEQSVALVEQTHGHND